MYYSQTAPANARAQLAKDVNELVEDFSSSVDEDYLVRDDSIYSSTKSSKTPLGAFNPYDRYVVDWLKFFSRVLISFVNYSAVQSHLRRV